MYELFFRGWGPDPDPGSSVARAIILSEFSNANSSFIVEDEFATRAEFLDISSIGLIKDTINNNWEMNTVSNVIYPIDEMSVQRIQVSKAIKNSSSGISARLIELPNDIFANQDIDESEKFTLFPNPASNVLNVNVVNLGKYKYSLTNILGVLVGDGRFTKTIQINTAQLKGIYFIEIIDGFGKRSVKKIVVNN